MIESPGWFVTLGSLMRPELAAPRYITGRADRCFNAQALSYGRLDTSISATVARTEPAPGVV